jgi:Flp pilus assembly pilin Flp
MPQQLWAFCLYEDGATAIEYAFLASLVAVAAFATMINLGDTLEMMFGVVSNGVTNSVNSSING